MGWTGCGWRRSSSRGAGITLAGLGGERSGTARFGWELTAQDREDIRWYLEDYLLYPIDPAPVIAARVEARIAEIGRDLFTKVFEANRDTARVWDAVSDRLSDVRVEVVATVGEATAIPWELLRDPATDVVLALRAHAFVRADPYGPQAPLVAQAEDVLLVLLVICRPGGAGDVPFRSVASHLVRLSRTAREAFQLDVLRPATFGHLAKVLEAAKQAGRPYHVVHFDGHGAYLDQAQLVAAASGGYAADPLRFSVLSEVREGSHGYLLFEDPETTENYQLVDGPALGRLLVETGVPALVLNACRSAHADLVTAPQTEADNADVHQRARAYGSLAQEVIHAGLGGVVAMRYNVYVVTAAQFVGDLYAALAEGQPLGQAVSAGRRQLAAKPHREIAFKPLPLRDWMVPIVYERAPAPLLAASAPSGLTIMLSQAEAAPERARVDPSLPADPDVGFYGRDETLLALDRAFDTQPIVLLHAWAGAGKTSLARWYQLTGGLRGSEGDGPVLFTTFTRHTPLVRVLDDLGVAFGPALRAAGVHWDALNDDAERRAVALQILGQVPVLWIWDNVEPVAGFPTGTPSAWTEDEQAGLVDFLRDVRATKARVLLTSRRDERGWLGDLPARVRLPAMPMAERVQLAKAIAAKHGRRLADVADWRPLLEFTAGNPLTITVLVGQALRDGLSTKAEVSDDVEQGRDRSLGASLGYGLDHAFTEPERAQLALLHLFQGFVNVGALLVMGGAEAAWCVPEVRGLDRQAGIGLLSAHGNGSYSVHPALPWCFH
ncbi:MAG: CHAT domain-containing protein, partial [Egibacteraceae bacterium]